MIDRAAAVELLDVGYRWVCERRRDYSPNSDVWDLRRRWPAERDRISRDLKAGTYRFAPTRVYRVDGETKEVWAAADAVVLKALTLVLGPVLAPHVSADGHGLAGRRGHKAAVRRARTLAGRGGFVCRTDIADFYTSIDHQIAYRQLCDHVDDPLVAALVWQYLRRTRCRGGDYVAVQRGISLGCPLSPLIAALYLTPVDTAITECGVDYVRFCDDVLFSAPTRHRLRRAIRAMHAAVAKLGLRCHPGRSDKTYIGRPAKGFDYLGYRLGTAQIAPSRTAVMNMVARIRRLHEQGTSHRRVGEYVRRWQQWARAGLTNTHRHKTAPDPDQHNRGN